MDPFLGRLYNFDTKNGVHQHFLTSFCLGLTHAQLLSLPANMLIIFFTQECGSKLPSDHSHHGLWMSLVSSFSRFSATIPPMLRPCADLRWAQTVWKLEMMKSRAMLRTACSSDQLGASPNLNPGPAGSNPRSSLVNVRFRFVWGYTIVGGYIYIYMYIYIYIYIQLYTLIRISHY